MINVVTHSPLKLAAIDKKPKSDQDDSSGNIGSDLDEHSSPSIRLGTIISASNDF